MIHASMEFSRLVLFEVLQIWPKLAINRTCFDPGIRKARMLGSVRTQGGGQVDDGI
jgi:hypothetical protein